MIGPDTITAAEQAVLGGLLLDNKARSRLNGLCTQDFTSEQHRLIFQAIEDEIEHDNTADTVTVFLRLVANSASEQAGGLPYLNSLAQNTPSTVNIERYADVVHTAAAQRNRAALHQEAAEAALRGDAVTETAICRQLESKPASVFKRVDLSALAQHAPQPPQFIVPDWLPCGEVTLYAGHGGSGKSISALMLATCVAAGRPFLGMLVQRRRVAFVSLEDPLPVIHWRLSRICAWIGIDTSALADWLILFDASDADADLLTQTREGLALTPAYYALRTMLADWSGGIVIDGASDSFAANENERYAVRRFVRSLRRLITPDGFVLLVAHVDKNTAKATATTQGYSGSTAWSNSVRSRWYLRPENDSDEFVLELQKANHAKAGASITVRWNASAHVLVGEMTMPASRMSRDLAEIDEREGILAAFRACAKDSAYVPAALTGPRTAYHVLLARPEFPKSLRSGKESRVRFWRQIEQLRAMGAILETSIARSDRHRVPVLTLPTEACG